MENKGFIVLMLGILAIAGCQPVILNSTGNQEVNANLEQGTYTDTKLFDAGAEINALTFKSEEEYLAFVQGNLGSAGGGMTYDMVSSVGGAATRTAAVAQEAADGKAAPSFSGTNNQVANVDEADIIKTDGEYIYTVSGTTVYIIKAYPGQEAEVVSTIKMKQRPQGLFIDGDNLAVFGSFYDLEFFRQIDFVPRQGMTFFNIYDVSARESPELTKEYKFEGGYFQSRMASDHVYFVTTTMPEYRRDYPTPVIIDGREMGSVAIPDIYYYPMPYDQAQLATVHAINLASGEKSASKTITVESSHNMYMSESNIFITYTKYVNEWELTQKLTIDMMMDKLTQRDKELIEKIKQVDNDVLSQSEKQYKILSIVQSYMQFMSQEEQEDMQERIQEALKEEMEKYDYYEYTVINKVSVDSGNIAVDANGKVPGHIMNQFSMDESDGVFRIATTISPRWNSWIKPLSGGIEPAVDVAVSEPAVAEEVAARKMIAPEQQVESENHIYTLNEDLEVIDSLTGIAKGEQIYSTRFMQGRLYMVTFRQVDPFFVYDLSDPENIKELGQLKIPGFSRYLHPYDDSTIIGIGRDASATTGQTRGLKISLFDVSEVSSPKETAKFITEERYAQSTAEYEHKAFLFDKDKELLVIPAYSYSYDSMRPGEGEQYNGAMVFRVAKDEIEMRGIIDHSSGQAGIYGPAVERSLYIDDLLYTKSPGMLRINKISDLSRVKNVELEGSSTSYPIY